MPLTHERAGPLMLRSPPARGQAGEIFLNTLRAGLQSPCQAGQAGGQP